MIGEFSYLCKLEIITSVIELNPAHGVTGKPWWNSKTFGSIKVIGGIDVKGIEITVKSKATLYGVLIPSNNQDLQVYNMPTSPTLNTTVGQAKIEINDLTMRITFQSKYTHYACIRGGSIANGTIKEIKE